MDHTLSAFLVSAIGMILVGAGGTAFWRVRSRVDYRWFWVGAGLWTVAVAIKLTIFALTSKAVIAPMKHALSHPLFILSGSLYVGIVGSLCEVGLTFAAVLIWRQLGRD